MFSIPKKTNNIPAIGLGTWGMGGRMEHDQDNDDARDIKAIQLALNEGVTHIDTAEAYAAGYSEVLTAKAMSDFARDKIFLASKVFATNLAYQDVLNSCEASLKRLQTEYIDLYYVHAVNNDVPLEETSKAFNELLRDGRIKNIGVCNFGVETMKAFQDLLDAPIIANQSHYSLVYREPEHAGLLKHCEDVGATFVAWRPLLWNDPNRTEQPAGNAWDRGAFPIMDQIADRYGKPNVQLALNWLINQPNVATLIKTTQEKHLHEVLECIKWELSSEDIETLRKEFPDQRKVSCAVPLG